MGQRHSLRERIEGDYALDVILLIVSERQIYQGITNRMILVKMDCTILEQANFTAY